MKILVFTYDLVFCGITVNAIDLATALRDIHGHEVVLFAAPGPMIKLVQEKGLRFLPAPSAYLRSHPSLERMRALHDVIRCERPDLIHVWEWVQCLDTYFGENLLKRVPVVVSDMSMSLQRMLPKSLPTTFGTPELIVRAKAAGYRQLKLLLPPVDVYQNAPNVVNPQPFRKRYGIEDNDITLVTISRLDTYMKAETLYRTIDAVNTLGHDLPLRFVIVGDGDVRPDLEQWASRINANLGRAAIVLTGALVDPRPAYAAADIVVGMGGSALRAMAFGKPTIIVGANGFSAPLMPETADYFYYKGIYGVRDGNSDNSRLVKDICELTEHPDKLQALGEFSRQFILRYFALDKVSSEFNEFCHFAVNNQPRLHVAVADGLRTLAVWIRERRFMPHGWSPRR